MFTRDTLITMMDGHSGAIGPMADLPAGATLMVRTKGATDELVLSSAPGEFVEVITDKGRKLRCAPKAKLCLAGGGYTYALEANAATADTVDGPEQIVTVNYWQGQHEQLVAVKLTRVHAVLVNGFWALVD